MSTQVRQVRPHQRPAWVVVPCLRVGQVARVVRPWAAVVAVKRPLHWTPS